MTWIRLILVVSLSVAGAQDSLAVKVIGPFLFVVIAIVIVYFVVSFILFRIARQIRRRQLEKQSIGSTSSTQRTVTRRMLAYALPYNVLDFKKAAESQSQLDVSSSGGPSICGTDQGRAAGEDQCPSYDPKKISELCGSSEKSFDFQELTVPVSKVHSSGSGMETKFLEHTPHRKGSRARSPVKQTKYLLKKMKQRRIRPLNTKEEKPRREDEASDGFSSCGSGVMCINDSFDLDSTLSTTSTFRMRLDQF